MSARDIAEEYIRAEFFENPEFLDVTEFIDEFYDDVEVESGDVYAEVYAEIEQITRQLFDEYEERINHGSL